MGGLVKMGKKSCLYTSLSTPRPLASSRIVVRSLHVLSVFDCRWLPSGEKECTEWASQDGQDYAISSRAALDANTRLYQPFGLRVSLSSHGFIGNPHLSIFQPVCMTAE